VICYQGAVVADADGTWLRHEPIPLELAREAIAAVEAEGYPLNVYVGDELYVSAVTKEARDYAGFQGLEIHEVGNLIGLARRAADEARLRRRPGRAGRCRGTDEGGRSATGCTSRNRCRTSSSSRPPGSRRPPGWTF